LVIFLNQTNEELRTDANSHQLVKGAWTASERPPTSILAGESGIWRSNSSKPGQDLMGSVAYRIAGNPDQHAVVISWQNPLLGWNTYRGSGTPKGFDLDIHGGSGIHATVVFILRRWLYQSTHSS
jgi:hypothetical protein